MSSFATNRVKSLTVSASATVVPELQLNPADAFALLGNSTIVSLKDVLILGFFCIAFSWE